MCYARENEEDIETTTETGQQQLELETPDAALVVDIDEMTDLDRLESVAERLAIFDEARLSKPEHCIREDQLLDQGNVDEFFDVCIESAESGCVRSMGMYGKALLASSESPASESESVTVSVSEPSGTSNKNSNHSHSYAHLALPWFLEGAIRGNIRCISMLAGNFYEKAKPNLPKALKLYWIKLHMTVMKSVIDSLPDDEGGDDDQYQHDNELYLSMLKAVTKGFIKEEKYSTGRECVICLKMDSETIVLRRCDSCKIYFYCSRECQKLHWQEQKHDSECRQLGILNKYHKPHVNEIRDAVIRGVAHENHLLQTLRTKLGLNRPEEEYEELGVHIYRRQGNVELSSSFSSSLPSMSSDHSSTTDDLYKCIVARKDGTVHVGSTTKII